MKKHEENLNPGPENDLKETPVTTAPESLDAPKLDLNHEDEVGQVAKTKLTTTTVEESTTDGEEFKKAWDESNPNVPEDQAEIDEMMKVVRAKNQNK